MGYTTDFTGSWAVTPPLEPQHREYLLAFANTRRMRRDAAKAELPIGHEGAYFVGGDEFKGQGNDDSIIDYNEPPGVFSPPCATCGLEGNAHLCQNVKDHPDPTPCGTDGYWNNHGGHKFQADDNPLLATEHQVRQANGLVQPGLWCQWVPDDSGTEIVWDGGEKFYDYIEWIEYLIKNFFSRWGYELNGTVEWEGEESGDLGRIVIKDNEVTVQHGYVAYR